MGFFTVQQKVDRIPYAFIVDLPEW